MKKPVQEREQKTALGYLRISDKKQIKGESIANQREAIQNYANANNIRIIDWFTDLAKSGKNADREELQNLIMSAAKMKGQIDYVLVYKMNRASRDIDSYVMMIKSQLAALGIRIRSVTEQFDDSPMGHFIENLHVMVGQLDNENKRETVIDNMRRIAQQGFWQHTPPRGYDICRMKNDEGKSRPSLRQNSEAPKVKDVLMRWNRGDIGEAQLMRYAETIGLLAKTTGKPLKQDVLHQMLINPIFAGYVCDQFTDYKRVKGRHEGLITPEIFEQNQLILRMKNKDFMLGLKHQKTNEMYPLRRFVRCINCDKYMTAASPKNSPRYYCARPTCPKAGSIMTRTLHPQFEELLALITPTAGTVKLLKEILKRQVKKELGDINHDIKRLRDRLDSNDAYKQKVLAKFINDKLSETEKDAALSGADAERVSLQAELLKLERRQTISEDSIELALGFMGNISKHWHSAPLELKQAYQELVFPEGFIYDIKSRKFITPVISPLYRVDLGETGATNAKNFGMVSLTRMKWHTLYPDIVNLHLRLNELGCIVYNGEVVMIDRDEEGQKHV